MLGCGSAGKFNFLSLLVNQLAPWIRCVPWQQQSAQG